MAVNKKKDHIRVFCEAKTKITMAMALTKVTKKVIRNVTCLIVMFLKSLLKIKLVANAF